MSYSIELVTEAIKQYKNLSKLIREQVKDILELLYEEPINNVNIIPLRDFPGYRYKKGDFRILYTVDNDKKLVTVYRIKHRKDAYE